MHIEQAAQATSATRYCTVHSRQTTTSSNAVPQVLPLIVSMWVQLPAADKGGRLQHTASKQSNGHCQHKSYHSVCATCLESVVNTAGIDIAHVYTHVWTTRSENNTFFAATVAVCLQCNIHALPIQEFPTSYAYIRAGQPTQGLRCT